MSDTEAWRDEAACRGMDPDFFFPERGESLRLIRAVCRTCPVKAECLEYALVNGETHGVWGGESERSRKQMRAARNLRGTPGPKPRDLCGGEGGYRRHYQRGEPICEECRRAHAVYTAEKRERAS